MEKGEIREKGGEEGEGGKRGRRKVERREKGGQEGEG